MHRGFLAHVSPAAQCIAGVQPLQIGSLCQLGRIVRERFFDQDALLLGLAVHVLAVGGERLVRILRRVGIQFIDIRGRGAGARCQD
jgi:hypothetical protein